MTMTVPRWRVPIEPLSVLKRRTNVFGGRVRMLLLWQEVIPTSSLVKLVRGFVDGESEDPCNMNMKKKQIDSGNSRFGIGR